MIRQHLCGTAKQPCPTPYLCSTGCAYTSDNPGYTHTMVEQGPGYIRWLDAVGNWLDRNGHWLAISFWLAIGLTAIALIVAGVLR